jgi:hypothetical protein
MGPVRSGAEIEFTDHADRRRILMYISLVSRLRED